MIIDLPLIASMSEIEIEMYIKGRKRGDFLNTIRLAEELESFARGENQDKFMIYSWLCWPNYEEMKGKTREDLYSQVNSIAMNLRGLTRLSNERQEELRATCDKICRLALVNGNPYRLGLIGLAA